MNSASQSSQDTSQAYRADIDGLRAIAVLSVLGFHAFPNVIRGGFVGVDIFFVISGFLITGVIQTGLDHNRFGFYAFYDRRIRRIFPALILVATATVAIGWFTLLDGEYKQLGKHVTGGAGFLSNFVLWNEAGYFDNSAASKPLLHLWSLGIEEQFYIFWPFVLWSVSKRQLSPVWTCCALVLASFAFNIFTQPFGGVADFYSPLSRFWEIGCGALIALTARGGFSVSIAAKGDYGNDGFVIRNILSAAGFLLICAALVLVTSDKPFPALWALFPTLGAALIVTAGPSAIINRYLLANRLCVWIGLISYPLYLWHWPILSVARIVEGQGLSIQFRLAIIALTFILALITYRVFEIPIRYQLRGNSAVLAGLVGLMLVLGSVGAAIYLGDGFNFRTVVTINPAAKTIVNLAPVGSLTSCDLLGLKKPDDENIFCYRDKRGNIAYALIGDSKASALFPGLLRTPARHGWINIGRVLPITSNSQLFEKFKAGSQFAIALVTKDSHIKVVVLTMAVRQLFQLPPGSDATLESLPSSGNYEVAFSGLDATVTNLIEAGKRVVITVDNPAMADPHDCLDRTTAVPLFDVLFHKQRNPLCQISYKKHIGLTEQYRRLLFSLKEKHPDIILYDPLPLICDIKHDVCSISSHGKFLYSIGDHISDYASDLIARDLVPLIDGPPAPP
jgi:peptidoglycan/LPS O-acetylase OafA/YrhL